MISGIFAHIDGSRAQVFRFYRDGLFLDCLVAESKPLQVKDLSSVKTWLKRESVVAGVIQGRYAIEKNQIQFKSIGHFGDGKRTIDYVGIYDGKQLILDSLDHNTGRRADGAVYSRIA